MKSFLGSFLVLAAAVLVLAAPRPGLAQRPAPSMVVQHDGKSESLGLERLDIEVRIVGYVADTSVTMTFANPLAQAMEGDLNFPLPEGATVSGYALDIQGQMVDGVSVERQHARDVFEAEKHRKVDPGLVEWTKGNWFRTRVFPVPALGRRTVRVQYLSELTDGPGAVCYRLPLRFDRPLPEFALRVEVVRPEAEPQVKQSALANFRFTKWRENFLAETKVSGARLDKDLVIALPDVEKPQARLEQADDGRVYFLLNDLPETPNLSPPRIVPRHIALYWDASGSRASADHQREVGIVRALLKAWTAPKADVHGSVKVDLITIRNVQSPPRRFVVTNMNIAELISALEQIDYDGGTQLGAIAPIEGANPDLALLFSDGNSTFGSDEQRSLDAPIFAFSCDESANRARLGQWACASGGRYFDLLQLDEQAIVDAVGRPAYSLLSAEASGGKVSEVLSAGPQPIVGHVTVVGRVESAQAIVTLRYGCRPTLSIRQAGKPDVRCDAALARHRSRPQTTAVTFATAGPSGTSGMSGSTDRRWSTCIGFEGCAERLVTILPE